MKFLDRLHDIWDRELSRKEFIHKSLLLGLTAGASIYLFDLFSKYKAFGLIGERRGMKEALFYRKTPEGKYQCLLCPQYCMLAEGQRGFCRVREPADGKLYTLVYELICSAHVDPIEKKPLFHVLPGTKAFSVATAGCNSRCKFCQNWAISQRSPEETRNQKLTCQDLARAAAMNGCSSIAYTYTEPNVFYEYVLDSAKEAKKKGIINISVTGGKINSEPLKKMCKVIDAANVDLKGFNEKYMREVCSQRLETVLNTLKIMKKEGVWIEITNLIVPTLNDNMNEIRKMVQWVKNELGEAIPIHFSRFWPQNKLRSLYPTPVNTLKTARDIALEEGMHYVYIGNVPEMETDSTTCPKCKKIVIKRKGYRVLENNIINGHCKFCGYKIPGIWKTG